MGTAMGILFPGCSREPKLPAPAGQRLPPALVDFAAGGSGAEPVPRFKNEFQDHLSSAHLLDPSLSPNQRLALARQLGERGNPRLWQDALATMLPEEVRETLLYAIGCSGRREAGDFLRVYLDNPEQGIRRATIRGLAATGSTEDAKFLGQWMEISGLPIEESTEIALALGGSLASNATGILLEAYPKAETDELGECILLALAQRPFTQTYTFFFQLLADEKANPKRRKEALQALAQFDTVSEEFFDPYLRSADPEVRSGAYLALGALSAWNTGIRLLGALQFETDVGARVSLWEALGMQPIGNSAEVSRLALAENEPATKILAGKVVARSLQGRASDDSAVVEFGRVWAPELTRLAIEENADMGLQAVSALAIQGKIPEVRLALAQIVRQAAEPRVREKAQKLLEAQP